MNLAAFEAGLDLPFDPNTVSLQACPSTTIGSGRGCQRLNLIPSQWNSHLRLGWHGRIPGRFHTRSAWLRNTEDLFTSPCAPGIQSRRLTRSIRLGICTLPIRGPTGRGFAARCSVNRYTTVPRKEALRKTRSTATGMPPPSTVTTACLGRHRLLTFGHRPMNVSHRETGLLVSKPAPTG